MSVSSTPPSSEIVAYAVDRIACRRCRTRAGLRCVAPAKDWQTVCKVRYADAAREYVPLWKERNKPARPPAPVLAGRTRPAVPLPAGEDKACPF